MEQKIQRKFFCFWYNCIWIGIVKLSLLRRGHFSWAANVLTRSPKTWYVNNRDFLLVNWVGSDQWIWSTYCEADFNRSSASLLCCFSKGSLKRGSLDIFLSKFSKSLISELQNLWGSSFLSKCSKFIPDFKNAAKKSAKVFRFWDNHIWNGIVKLSLSRIW